MFGENHEDNYITCNLASNCQKCYTTNINHPNRTFSGLNEGSHKKIPSSTAVVTHRQVITKIEIFNRRYKIAPQHSTPDNGIYSYCYLHLHNAGQLQMQYRYTCSFKLYVTHRIIHQLLNSEENCRPTFLTCSISGSS